MMDRPHLNQTAAILIGTAAIVVTVFLASMGGVWALAHSDTDLRATVAAEERLLQSRGPDSGAERRS